MYPTIHFWDHFSIHTFGILVACGVLVAAFLIRKNASSIGVSPNDASDLVLVTVITGFLGARAFFVFQFRDYFKHSPLEIFRIWEGGIVIYGGVIAALLGFFIYCQLKRLSFVKLLDLFVPAVALAQGFGRVGCFLNGCCYGIKTTLPWGVLFRFTDKPVHPVQLYESGYCFLLSAFLFWLWRKRLKPGTVALSYFILYPAGRFFVEFLRGDNPRLSLGLTLPQWMSIGFILLSSVLFVFRFLTHGSKRNSHPA